MKRGIRYIGDPILRQKAKPVESITDEIKTLAADMLETMEATNGIGLAAPQIGVSLRLFVLAIVEETEEGRIKLEQTRVYINPIIESVSKEQVKMNEGCLSIPGLYVDQVLRPEKITVRYTDLEGVEHVETVESWHARVILHENDHLNGVLFIDRLTPSQKKEIEFDLKKIKKKFSKKNPL